MICKNNNCNKRACFNFLNTNKGLYCVEHKEYNMINVTKKTCIEQNCNKRACFNLPNEKIELNCIVCHIKKKI